jgi:hypothetical protein
MKLSTIMCAAAVAMVATGNAFGDPGVNYNASKSNTGNVTAHITCPTSESIYTDPKTGKQSCVYISSKTGNMTSTDTTGKMTMGASPR